MTGKEHTVAADKKLRKKVVHGQKAVGGSLYLRFTASVLALESVLVFCATLAAWGLMQGFYGSDGGRYSLLSASERLRPLVLAVGLSLVALLLIGVALLRKPWGAAYGWGAQFLLCAFGVLLVPMFLIGAAFACMWWYAIKTGRRLDRENSEPSLGK